MSQPTTLLRSRDALPPPPLSHAHLPPRTHHSARRSLGKPDARSTAHLRGEQPRGLCRLRRCPHLRQRPRESIPRCSFGCLHRVSPPLRRLQEAGLSPSVQQPAQHSRAVGRSLATLLSFYCRPSCSLSRHRCPPLGEGVCAPQQFPPRHYSPALCLRGQPPAHFLLTAHNRGLTHGCVESSEETKAQLRAAPLLLRPGQLRCGGVALHSLPPPHLAPRQLPPCACLGVVQQLGDADALALRRCGERETHAGGAFGAVAPPLALRGAVLQCLRETLTHALFKCAPLPSLRIPQPRRCGGVGACTP
eukprot:Hpha_TRINITY_DN31094_c0_g1::TRINITY_DN31094_c0_g1_i1::g.64092::m.64092